MSKIVIVGKFGAPHGVRGWISINSYTSPFENILKYPEWLIQKQKQWVPIKIAETKQQHDNVIVRLQDINDRNEAHKMTNSYIGIDHADLPELERGEYYWTDLIGLKVITVTGVELGKVEYLFATGANDVMVIKDQNQQERLIPYIDDVVKDVDLSTQQLVVDWEADF